METQTNDKTTRKYEKKKICHSIQLDQDSAKHLAQLQEKINSKNFGRKIYNYEIVAKALNLITQTHLEELQNKSLRAKDQLQIAYKEYQKKNGKISFDNFLAQLLTQNNAINKI